MGKRTQGLKIGIRKGLASIDADDVDRYYDESSSKDSGLRAPKTRTGVARTFDLPGPSGNTLFIMGALAENRPLALFPGAAAGCTPQVLAPASLPDELTLGHNQLSA